MFFVLVGKVSNISCFCSNKTIEERTLRVSCSGELCFFLKPEQPKVCISWGWTALDFFGRYNVVSSPMTMAPIGRAARSPDLIFLEGNSLGMKSAPKDGSRKEMLRRKCWPIG